MKLFDVQIYIVDDSSCFEFYVVAAGKNHIKSLIEEWVQGEGYSVGDIEIILNKEVDTKSGFVIEI